MFDWLFRSRREQQTQEAVKDEMIAIQQTCIALFRDVWRKERQSRPNRGPVSPQDLADQIEEFSNAAFRVMFEQFPLTRHAPPFTLWLIVFTAVLEAKTHPVDIVNEAIDILRAAYAK